jgi:hypothetical protein
MTSTLDPVSRLRAIQHETLARAIIGFNGQPVNYKAQDKEEKVDKYKLIQQNLEILKKSNQQVIETIFIEYEKLLEKQTNQVDDLKKKLPKVGQDKDGKLQK